MPASFDPDAPALEGSGIYGLPYSPDDAHVVLIPVPWDATTSYRAGTSSGPEAILTASHQVDLFDIETGKPYEHGIAMLDISEEILAKNTHARKAAEPIIAAGGVVDQDQELQQKLEEVNKLSGEINKWVEQQTEVWLDRGKLVGIVGGDHSTPFGAIKALARRYANLGVLHIDAHADLRIAYEGFTWSHASIMYNVLNNIHEVTKLVQVGIRDLGSAEYKMIESSGGRIVTHFDSELKTQQHEGQTWASQCSQIVAALPDHVYISFDIDGLDPVLCPNTGTPVAGGLSFHQATYLMGRVAQSGRKIVGFDLNEVAPSANADDEWDANVGARILYKMIGWALRSGL